MAVSFKKQPAVFLKQSDFSVLNYPVFVYFAVPEVTKKNVKIVPKVCKYHFNVFDKVFHIQFLLIKMSETSPPTV